MDMFQQQTAAFFMRRWIENAVDRGDWAEAQAMSLRLDELTAYCLLEEIGTPITATGGRA